MNLVIVNDEPSGTYTFRDLFPGLLPLSRWSLAGVEVAPLIQSHDEHLELTWLTRHDVHTIGELLAIGPGDIGLWHGFGVGKVERLVEFARRLDAGATDLLAQRFLVGETPETPGKSSLLLNDAQHDLAVLIEWARLSAGAVTLRDVIGALAADDGPEDVVDRVRDLLDSPVPALDLDPMTELGTWIAALDDRDRSILERRLIRFEGATLDELGREFGGVTRERIRQLETKLQSRLTEWVASDGGRSVRWALHLLARGLGACAPDSEVPLIGADGGHSQEFGLLLYLAGIVWDRDAHVIHRRGFAWPKPSCIPRVDDGPVVDEPALHSLLADLGVVDDHVQWAVGQIKGLRRLDNILVMWPVGMVDQGLAVLTVSGVPMSHTEIAERIGRDINVRGLRNRLMDDPRVMRATKGDLGLTSWGLPEYGGIVASMVQRLEEGGPTTVAGLATYLAELHSTKPGSVYAYAAAPVFIRDGDLIRLRRADEPYAPVLNLPSVKGMYRLGPSRLVWHMGVDRELLRGSGLLCPAEVATAIGVYPGRSETLANSVREVRITWTATTHMGPTISTLRAHAEALGAKSGDRLRLVVDGGSRAVEVTLAPRHVDSIELLADLLGVPPDGLSKERVARALDVPVEEVESTLHSRDETDIAALVEAGFPSG